MESLQLTAGIIGLIAYILLIYGVFRGQITQSFATYLLWALLDLIAAITVILQYGNYVLPLLYGICAAIVALLLAIKKIRAWSWVETMCTVLIIVSLVVWYLSGNKVATIVSTLAVVIAGIPQTVEIYKKPTEAPLLIYFVFLLANILSVFAGKSWTIEERFYPGAMVVVTVVVIAVGMKRFFKLPIGAYQ